MKTMYYPTVAANRALDNLVKEVFDEKNTNYFNPATNVYQTEDKYQIDLALPGFTKELVEITVEDNTLYLSGELKPAEDKVEYTKRTIPFGKFEKNYKLPERVQKDKIEAKFENGILSVVVPKVAKEEYTKSITIN